MSEEQIGFKELYKQVCDKHRFYGDMRFKQLSAYGVINALLINAGATKDSSVPMLSGVAICVIALLTTSVLWVMEVRSSIYGYQFFQKGESLEANHSIVSWKPANFRWALINATNAVLVFYVISYSLWCCKWLISYRCQYRGLLVFFIFWGAVLIVYSSREHWQRWKDHYREWKW